MTVKLATNFGAGALATGSLRVGGYFDQTVGSGPEAPGVSVFGASGVLEHDGGDMCVQYKTLQNPGPSMTRDFNTLDGFTISEGHFQFRLYVPTLNMGAVAGLTYEFIELLDSSSNSLILIKLLRGFAATIANFRVDTVGGWTGTTSAGGLATGGIQNITVCWDSSNASSVARMRLYTGQVAELSRLNLTNSGSLAAVAQIKIGGLVSVPGNDGGSTFQVQHLLIDDNTFDTGRPDFKTRAYVWRDRPGIPDQVSVDTDTAYSAYGFRSQRTDDAHNIPSGYDDFTGGGVIGATIDKWAIPTDAIPAGNNKWAERTVASGTGQQLWKSRQDIVAAGDPAAEPAILAVSLSVAALHPDAADAAPMQAIIHDGTNALLVSPVRWVFRNGSIDQGVWLLLTQADGSTAWTYDAIRSHWFGVEYDTAAAGNPGAAVDDLRVYHLAIEVWYVDIVGGAFTAPKPPQSRRPLAMPQMVAM